ncbi:hypothetical protein GCM10010431_17000 [Streptomyces kunmingensis]
MKKSTAAAMANMATPVRGGCVARPYAPSTRHHPHVLRPAARVGFLTGIGSRIRGNREKPYRTAHDQPMSEDRR